MKKMRHPNFIFGIFSLIMVFIAIALKANSYRSGDYVLIGSVVLGAIHYIWSIIDLVNRKDLKPFQKRFWLIAVVAVPALGSLVFYVMHQKRDKLTT
jgi:hypothetical protein